jgi:hypothetical protein
MPAMAKEKRAKRESAGRPAKDDPRDMPTVVHLTESEREAVDVAAEKIDRPRSYWIRQAILEKLEREANTK